MNSDNTYRIPEGGVCGAFNTEATSEQRARKTARLKKTAQTVAEPNWNKVPTPAEDPWIRVAEVVEEINKEEYVPTDVLQDTLEMVRQRHHGDEPTTDQQSAVTLIEQELDNRGEDGGYAEARKKNAQIITRRGAKS